MATVPYEIIAGPADVWVAAVGEAFTDVDDAVAGTWVSLGKTEGGINVTHDQDIELLYADQRSGPQKAIRPREGLIIEFSIMELTLERYAKLLNNATVTADAGPPATKTIKLYQNFDVVQYALLVRGPSPYTNGNLQYNVPVVVQTESPETSFVKDDKSILSAAFTALEDPNAATAADRFGSLVAATA
jgi:hypothetical protein